MALVAGLLKILLIIIAISAWGFITDALWHEGLSLLSTAAFILIPIVFLSFGLWLANGAGFRLNPQWRNRPQGE